jgi:glucokinase
MTQAQQILVADLGGTHARFLLASSTGPFDTSTALELPSADYGDMDSLVSDALMRLKVADPAKTQAMLAVAGPVQDGCAKLTNLSWNIDAAALKQRFGFKQVGVLNDLAAAAWAISDSPPQDAKTVKEGKREGRCLVISVSTGVGTAYWSKSTDHVQVDAAEGGHMAFAADEEWSLSFLRALQAQHGSRISWERVLCGSGFAALDALLRGGKPLAAAEVTQRAKAGEATALDTVRHYTHMLGAFAGDLVLGAPAPGGVWIMGGVVAGLGAAFDAKSFQAGFADKGRLSSHLAQVPVHLTADDWLGLRGAWVLARHQA